MRGWYWKIHIYLHPDPGIRFLKLLDWIDWWIHNLMALLRDDGNFQKWELFEEIGHWGCVLGGYISSGSFMSVSLCFLATIKWAALLHHAPLPYHRPETTEPYNHGMKSLKLWAKTNVSNLLFLSDIYHSDEKLNDTPPQLILIQLKSPQASTSFVQLEMSSTYLRASPW
jgi:hypothetical protein